MCIFFYLQNEGFISDDFGQVSNEKSVVETSNNIGTICSYTGIFLLLVGLVWTYFIEYFVKGIWAQVLKLISPSSYISW